MSALGLQGLRLTVKDLFTIFIIVALAACVYTATDWPLRASIIVLVLGSLGVLLATAQLLVDVLGRSRSRPSGAPRYELPGLDAADDPRAFARGSLEIWAWLLGLMASVKLVGLPVALVGFVLLYTVAYRGGWRIALFLAVLIGAFIYGVYQQIMHVYWPDSYLGDLLSRFF
jgi:hypothetical protein